MRCPSMALPGTSYCSTPQAGPDHSIKDTAFSVGKCKAVESWPKSLTSMLVTVNRQATDILGFATMILPQYNCKVLPQISAAPLKRTRLD